MTDSRIYPGGQFLVSDDICFLRLAICCEAKWLDAVLRYEHRQFLRLTQIPVDVGIVLRQQNIDIVLVLTVTGKTRRISTT